MADGLTGELTGGCNGGVPSLDAGLHAWLDWIDAVHPAEMELGLERVTRIAERMNLRQPPLFLVSVGGTNGKGSTVAMLEAIWTRAGYRTGAATSPHVERFNERIRIGGREASDADIVAALAMVESARGEIQLTYFEFATLASMQLFVDAACDVAIMEVGLGGRLDAVNLWDADAAVLTSIALDHADWLGTDRSVIATEKAAIGRRGRPLILGDPDPPESLAIHVRKRGIPIIDVGALPIDRLPLTSLAGEHQRRNAGCALGVVEAMATQLPVVRRVAHEALANVSLIARFEEWIVDGTFVIMDVAHNPAAAESLASAWRERFGARRAIAVFAALADKDIESIATALGSVVAHWICPALDGGRATPADVLVRRVRDGIAGAPDGLETSTTVESAVVRGLQLARAQNAPMLVCGSFLTITAARAALAH